MRDALLDAGADPNGGELSPIVCAAEQGHAEAQATLAYFMDLGYGFDEADTQSALVWLNKSAEQMLPAIYFQFSRAACEAAVRRASAMASATSCGPPVVGVGMRSSPSTYMASVSWTYPASELLALKKQRSEADVTAGAIVDAGINIELITTSEIRITCIIDRDRIPAAVRALHAAFELSGPDTIRPEQPFGEFA